MKKRALKIKLTSLKIGQVGLSLSRARISDHHLLSAGSSTATAVAPDASRCVSIVSSVELVPECCPARLAESRFRELTTDGSRVTQTSDRQGRARGQDERRAVQLLVHIQVHHNR